MATSILIIDDSDKVREQIVLSLRKFGVFDRYLEASDGIEAFNSLLSTPVDLILCDLEMPRMDGFKFLTMIKSREELRDIPIIILTSHEARDMKVRGLEQGASDYVTKPFDPGELMARVKIQLKIKVLQDELRQSNDLLKRLSNTDDLTQLHNRRYMMEILERELARARRQESPLSFVMMDIDHFKSVNDRYGHQQGDSVLKTIALLTRNAMRNYDFAIRYGGEEFVLVLPGTPLDEAFNVGERLRQVIEQHSFGNELASLRVTISMGVATFPATGVLTVYDLIREADAALYRAKQGGRNMVVPHLPAVICIG
jgi:two-component system cell cycle response regulator